MPKASVDMIKWRRDKVVEYAAEGRTVPYIAEKLKVPPLTIYRDIRYLNEGNGLADWLDKRLPWEYHKGIKSYDMLASKMWDIVNDDSIDPRVRVGAGSVIANVTDRKLSMLGRKDTLKRTVKLITKLKEHYGLPRGLTVQNTKETIVTAEEEEESETTSDHII